MRARRRDAGGCSPELADKIVRLLLCDQGTCGVLATHLGPGRHEPGTQEAEPEPRAQRRRKLTPALVAFLHARHGTPVPELVRMVREDFGVVISCGSVYKAWRLPAP